MTAARVHDALSVAGRPLGASLVNVRSQYVESVRAASASSGPRPYAVAGTVAVAALAACGGGGSGGGSSSKYGFPRRHSRPSAKITVWVDSDRSAATTAFKKANPERADQRGDL